MAEEITGGLVDFKSWLISVFREDINILYWIRSCIPVLYKMLEMVLCFTAQAEKMWHYHLQVYKNGRE